MSTSVPPRDGDARTVAPSTPSTLSPTIVLGDEQALKRAFDSEFEPCMTSARNQLGEAATLAPKVVESAFVAAWSQRDRFTTATQLASFLAQEVMHGSARALSRRASGHRFGALGSSQASAHTTDASQFEPARVWSQIQTTIRGPARNADASLARTAPAAGHEAASHMTAATKKRSWVVPVTIGVVALAASIAGVLYVDRLGEDDAVLQTVDSPSIQALAGSESGQIGTLSLGDGSKVRMGPQTKLFAPDGFPSKIRALRLEGTASFEVAPGKTLPFRVVAKRIQVIATGTQFVVSAYPSDSGIVVTVREGSVTVKSRNKTSTVAAGQSMYVQRDTMRAPNADELLAASAWVDGTIGVQHKPLRVVVDELTRWFNYDVKVPDLSLLDRDASFNVPLDSSRLAIEQVEKSASVKFAYEGDSKIFRDAKKK